MTAPQPPFDVDGFILAGGLSTRMGRDKASLVLGGVRFIEAIEAAVRPLVATTTIIGTRAPDFGVPIVDDDRPGCGPLAAIETALRLANRNAFVIACDLPLVTTAFVRFLLEAHRREPSRIVVPEDKSGRITPLCGVYPGDLLRTVTALLDSGERKPVALLNLARAHAVAFSQYAHLEGAGRFLLNVNTPDDLARLGLS